jgi:hypothetical protein
MAGKKPIIKLRVYRGEELNYNADGTIKNENQLVSLTHNSRNWVLFMKNLRNNGYCKVEVEKAFSDLGNSQYEEIKDISAYNEEVQDAFSKLKQVNLTPEQKRIAELEAKLEAFMKASKPTQEKIVEKQLEKSIEDIRVEYEEVVGKKPHHMAKAETLIKEIQEKK